ncbi:MAG: hypothetical protein NTV05_04520 [Acidobacteria bacterium]|nr:hypothetical protein [Acidobacteriota bacterium]
MSDTSVRHYLWAGLDFMIDRDGIPVLLDANRSSHMMTEYLEFFGDDRPFALTAGRMNRADGPPCLLWRRGEPLPDGGEDAPFIGHHLAARLTIQPAICDAEDNQDPRATLISRDGRIVSPGSIFRWWYGLPWTYERAGVLVVNPNCVWTIVRDKASYQDHFAGSRHFRVAQSFPVETPQQAVDLIAAHPDLFGYGFVLKPRVGWGGYGVQIGDAGDLPRQWLGDYVLCERVMPTLQEERFWDVRVFVMDGEYLGGIQYSSAKPVTNFHQGGAPSRLDHALAARLREPAIEAVRRVDKLADTIHRLPDPPQTPLVNVVY